MKCESCYYPHRNIQILYGNYYSLEKHIEQPEQQAYGVRWEVSEQSKCNQKHEDNYSQEGLQTNKNMENQDSRFEKADD